jgi:hypothetical protein
MNWIVERKIDGKWKPLAILATRSHARSLRDYYYDYFGYGHAQMRVSKVVTTDFAFGSDIMKIVDLGNYIPESFSYHKKENCSFGCGVVWVNEIIAEAKKRYTEAMKQRIVEAKKRYTEEMKRSGNRG